MRRIGSSLLSVIALAVLLCGGSPATAQTCPSTTAPYPNGCSVPFVPLFVANGLDYIFLGACYNHDLCYATPNPSSGPCYGYGLKGQCDIVFLAHMESVCLFYASILAFPDSGWTDEDDFLDDCSAVAGVFYSAVALGGYPAYERRQCCTGCNQDMCDAALLPYPTYCPYPGCGYIPPPPPPPPPPPRCETLMRDTATWLIGPDGDAAPAPEQLDYGLQRIESRPESQIYMEEWALVSVGGGVSSGALGLQQTSVGDFGFQAASSVAASMPHRIRDTTVLVVEAAVHQLNGREIPVPSVVPFEVDLGRRNRAADGASLWFRAEVDPDGNVDRVTLLDPTATRRPEDVENAIRNNLGLRYEDDRRHRSVVYGVASIDGRGRMKVRDNGFVALPQCCCGGEFCI